MLSKVFKASNIHYKLVYCFAKLGHKNSLFCIVLLHTQFFILLNENVLSDDC